MYQRQHMYYRECLVGGLVVLVYSCEAAWLNGLTLLYDMQRAHRMSENILLIAKH